jgi:hypothetical protein
LIEKKADEIFVLCWAHYAPAIAFMYRDDQRIKVVPITGGRELFDCCNIIPQVNSKYLYWLGHSDAFPSEYLASDVEYHGASWGFLSDNYSWLHRCYYEYSKVDWKYRFTEFSFARSMENEFRVFNKLNPNHEEYIFVHDDPSRGHHLNVNLVKDLVGKDIKIIRNDPSEMLFFYPMILQNAKQIHLMESSFRCLIETIPTESVEFYFHDYVRRTGRLVYNDKICPVETRKPWVVVE